MSKKSEETKAKETEKTEKADEKEEKSAEAQKKPAKAAEKSEEATEKEPEKAEKADEKKEAPAETQEKPPKAAKKAKAKEEKPEAPEQQPADVSEKPLEKMTVKELREMAKDIPGMAGVHAMKKDELIVGLKKAKGIKEEPVKKADTDTRELKQKIKVLKVERQAALESKDKKRATILRRRISRLKKKTRRAAA